MKKQFLSLHGDWESSPESYDLQVKQVELEEFSEDNGYDKDESNAIDQLDINGVWDSPNGNHKVIRVV